jgi:signal peptidase I
MPASSLLRELCKHNLADEVLRTTGVLRLAAFGYSMLPTLWPGDVLIVQAHAFDQLQPGDVVLFSRDGRFFIHRILRRLEDGSRLLTRGDAMPDPDAPVSANALLGKVVSVERGSLPVPIPRCSWLRRLLGLILAYSSRLRSLALRWHSWRSPAPANDLAPDQIVVR